MDFSHESLITACKCNKARELGYHFDAISFINIAFWHIYYNNQTIADALNPVNGLQQWLVSTVYFGRHRHHVTLYCVHWRQTGWNLHMTTFHDLKEIRVPCSIMRKRLINFVYVSKYLNRFGKEPDMTWSVGVEFSYVDIQNYDKSLFKFWISTPCEILANNIYKNGKKLSFIIKM